MSPVEHLPRYLLSFFAAVGVSALLTPVMGGLAERFGILDRPRPGRFHRSATPYLGGLAVGAGLVTVGAAATGLSGEVATILVCGAAMCLLGFVDDWRTVRPLPKILVEVSAGAALWAVGIRAGLFGVASLDFCLTVLWVLVVVNAVNFGDNMDGLASGLAALSALGFFGIAAGEGHFLVASLAIAVCGASLGFLGHNFPPAKIFLGDAGSLLLGFLLAALALQLDIATQPGIVRAALPVLVLAVPLFDMAVVVAVRFLERRPIYLGATDHTSHRLAARGASPSRVAFTAFAIQAACSGLAVVLSTSPQQILVVGVTGFAAGAAAAWGVLVYAGRGAVDLQVAADVTRLDSPRALQNAGE